jgi:GAF domain-containing protein
METLRVADVHEFAGHIVCDPQSRSELVVPLPIRGELIGVLDIDSPKPSRFNEADQSGVELLCETFVQALQQGSGEFI